MSYMTAIENQDTRSVTRDETWKRKYLVLSCDFSSY